MARSSYIWVVHCRETGAIHGAFTVKHELLTWLKSEREEGPLTPWVVTRVRDGEGLAVAVTHRADIFLRNEG